MNAVNMDTGYVNYLSEPEKRDVLRWTVEALGKDAPLWPEPISKIKPATSLLLPAADGFDRSGRRYSILFQTARLCSLSSKEKARFIRLRVRDMPMCWLLSWAQCSRQWRNL